VIDINLRKDAKPNGRIYLSIGQGYRDKNGKSKSKTIKSIGYVDEFLSQYADPIAHFEEVVKKMNEEDLESKKPELMYFDKSIKLEPGVSERNIGYAAFSKIYHELNIDKFYGSRQRSTKAEYNINSIVKLLVYSRLLDPGSKKRAYEKREWYFEKMDFSLDDVYRSLVHIGKYGDDLQVWMHERILANYGRDMTFVYYDVTNYHFEIDDEDEMLRKGVSKNHRPDPIVQMGLLMDNNGVPMTYDLFPGNQNDCKTLVPILANVRRRFNVGKTVVVADKGMNTGSNAYYIANRRGWYIFSQTVRGGTKELKKYVLDSNGYVSVGTEYKVKSRQFTREVEIEQGEEKPTITVTISEKQVVFYSEKYNKKAKKDREKAIQKAKDIVKDPKRFKKYNTHGAAKYIGNLEYDEETGEIMKTKNKIYFDEEKLKEDEKYDGYYLIVTNCFNKDDKWVVEKYRGLWQIEETFKVSKSDLEARPVYVKRWEHIKAHFLICFVALTIIRLLQNRLSGKYYPTKIIESLSRACCAHIDTNRYMAYYYNEVLDDIGKTLDIDFDKKFMVLSDIRKLIGDTKK
jgi:hypothetical protein